jgi:hypothetical protein
LLSFTGYAEAANETQDQRQREREMTCASTQS